MDLRNRGLGAGAARRVKVLLFVDAKCCGVGAVWRGSDGQVAAMLWSSSSVVGRELLILDGSFPADRTEDEECSDTGHAGNNQAEEDDQQSVHSGTEHFVLGIIVHGRVVVTDDEVS